VFGGGIEMREQTQVSLHFGKPCQNAEDSGNSRLRLALLLFLLLVRILLLIVVLLLIRNKSHHGHLLQQNVASVKSETSSSLDLSRMEETLYGKWK